MSAIQPSRVKQGKVRIGIIGLGFGQAVHVPAFRGLDGVAVTALLGRDPERLRAAADLTGIPGFLDLDAFLSCGLDAVSVALPPGAVEPVVAAALERGLAVFCDKPLGPDLATARRLAARAASVATALCLEFSELATFAALRTAIERGAIGQVRHVSVVWLSESAIYRRNIWSWKADAAQHGGVLTLFGAHVFHMLELILGPAIGLTARLDARASARLRPHPDARPAEDTAILTTEHLGGATASIVVGNASPGLSSHRWTVVGDQGGAILDNPTQDHPTAGFALTVTGRDGAILAQHTEPAADTDGRIPCVRALAARFVGAIRTGDRCRPDFADGARVAALIDASRRAARARCWVDVGAAER